MTEFDRAIRRAAPRPDTRPDTRPYLERRGALWLILLAAFVLSALILARMT